MPALVLCERNPPTTQGPTGPLPAEIAGRAHFLTRPLLASRLLHALDIVTLREFGFAPELRIGAAPETGLRDWNALREVIRARLRFPRRIRALVVTASVTLYKQVALVLNSAGAGTVHAANPQAARDVAAQLEVGLVVIDSRIGRGVDPALCEAIAARGTAPLPRFVLLVDPLNPWAGRKCPVHASLPRPVDFEPFAAALEGLFARAEPRIERQSA